MIQANPLPTEGVVGHLTKDQEATLKQFWISFFELLDAAPTDASTSATMASPAATSSVKNTPKSDAEKEKKRAEEETAAARIALQKYGSVQFLATFWSLVAMDNPDGIVLRFLRARKWNVNAGVAMLAACIKWRIEQDVDSICARGEEGLTTLGFQKLLKKGQSFVQGLDRHGRPVVYINACLHKASDQEPKDVENFIVLLMESVRQLLVPPADKVTIVFNMNGFSLSNMDWNTLSFLIKCLEGYYPECLNCIIVHSAPFVVNGIWKIVSPLLDPIVRAKVQFTNKPADLFGLSLSHECHRGKRCHRRIVHIPEHHVVPQLGGKTTWTFQYPEVVPGENAALKDTETRQRYQSLREGIFKDYVEMTRQWTTSSDATVAEKRSDLSKALRLSFFLIDPYTRARTYWHRVGNAVGNGQIIFAHPQESGVTEWDVRGLDTCTETISKELEGKYSSLPSSIQALLE